MFKQVYDIVHLKAWRTWIEADFQFCLFVMTYVVEVSRLFEDRFVEGTLILAASIAAYGALGVLINDYFDMEYDRRAGKSRSIYFLPKHTVITLIALLSVTAILTLAAIGNEAYTLMYLGTMLLAFCYSAPFPRFKERGVLGVFGDILIERTLPVTLILFFYNILSYDGILLILLGSAFQLEIILRHQVLDRDRDKATGVETLVGKSGIGATSRLLRRIVWPSTTLIFCMFCALLVLRIIYFAPFYLLFAFAYYLFRKEIATGRVNLSEPVRPFYFNYIVVLSDVAVPLLLALSLLFSYFWYLPLVFLLVLAQSERYVYFSQVFVGWLRSKPYIAPAKSTIKRTRV